jgi:hypothetical protein
VKEYAVITDGQRSQKWTEGPSIRLRVHLLPFFGKLGLSEITAGKVQEYRVHRMTPPAAKGKGRKTDEEEIEAVIDATTKPPAALEPPSRSALHDEIVTLHLAC